MRWLVRSQLPALAIDRMGRVLDTNAAAAAMFDYTLRVRDHCLWIKDPGASSEFERFLAAMRASSEADGLHAGPILVRRP